MTNPSRHPSEPSLRRWQRTRMGSPGRTVRRARCRLRRSPWGVVASMAQRVGSAPSTLARGPPEKIQEWRVDQVDLPDRPLEVGEVGELVVAVGMIGPPPGRAGTTVQSSPRPRSTPAPAGSRRREWSKSWSRCLKASSHSRRRRKAVDVDALVAEGVAGRVEEPQRLLEQLGAEPARRRPSPRGRYSRSSCM